ncbi:MAG: LPS export ABC transporter ATP-binding protein [Holosporales bacterium]|jgi:lipopolysaccharide export system ATP-binding protein|nr:LPS export ABC transporter ATP-binding protein [Holosporales bacterium]
MTLDVVNVAKSFRERPVLRGLTVSFNIGEIVGVLGPNGAGKTTLFSILAGIMRADCGQIRLAGSEITTLKIHQRARAGIVYLPQDSSIFRGLSVEDNIKAVLQITYSSRKQVNTKLEELLDAFSITHLRKSKAPFLSGGERRKVEITRALATSPSFLMLDEPFSGIDPISVSEIVSIIKSLKHQGIGVIITDHNVRETLQVIDRGYIIANGEILTSGSVTEIMNDEGAKKQYLGSKFKI